MGHACTQKMFVASLKFELNWVSCILLAPSGNSSLGHHPLPLPSASPFLLSLGPPWRGQCLHLCFRLATLLPPDSSCRVLSGTPSSVHPKVSSPPSLLGALSEVPPVHPATQPGTREPLSLTLSSPVYLMRPVQRPPHLPSCSSALLTTLRPITAPIQLPPKCPWAICQVRTRPLLLQLILKKEEACGGRGSRRRGGRARHSGRFDHCIISKKLCHPEIPAGALSG